MLARNRGIPVLSAFLALTPRSTAAIDSLRRGVPLLFEEASHFPLSHLDWYLTIFLWTLSTLFHRFSHLEAPHFHYVFARDSRRTASVSTVVPLYVVRPGIVANSSPRPGCVGAS